MFFVCEEEMFLVRGWGEAELHAVGILLVGSLDLRVVDDHEGLDGLLGAVELDQAADGLVTLGRKPFDFVWGWSTSVSEQSLHFFILHLGNVVEVQDGGWLDDSVLGCSLWSVKPIVSVSAEVSIGFASIRKIVGVPDLVNVLLLGPVETKLEAKDG